jgi:hypothetical protein
LVGALRQRTLAPFLLAAAACATAPGTAAVHPTLERGARAGAAPLVVRAWPGGEAEAARIAGLLPAALAGAERWAHVAEPVVITVHATQAGLEAATGVAGFPGLRAWARSASIDLESPRRWSRRGADDVEVRQLLAHELAHCAMYQAVAPGVGVPGPSLPFWFREGMAMVAAAERPMASAAQIARYVRDAERGADLGDADGPGGGQGGGSGAAAPGADALATPEVLLGRRADLAYGVAQLAFARLLQRHGEQSPTAILTLLKEGHPFAAAFAAATGSTEEAFAGEVRRQVLDGGGRD